ncbi:nucleotidyltransferase domain-containing protein [Hydrocarboniphaga sp.]|uniref:nucleotidyltransferase domain-containing protein n=1 Tax=Hydrocarboniphaga sp. TaxID=2033016 RepID=UPI003451BCB0
MEVIRAQDSRSSSPQVRGRCRRAADCRRGGELGGDIFVHGSRAAGTARVDSDIDIGIRLGAAEFDDFLMNQSRLGKANPGSAAERTLTYAQENGL